MALELCLNIEGRVGVLRFLFSYVSVEEGSPGQPSAAADSETDRSGTRSAQSQRL